MRRRAVLPVVLVMAVVCGLAALYMSGRLRVPPRVVQALTPGPDPLALISNPNTPAEKIVNRAKQEVIEGVRYDAGYVRLSYPGGDVPADRGACTDVVVRALRGAGYDLQRLVHEDMSRNFRLYPRKWRLTRPDPSIDHRRVPNLMVFLSRFGRELPKRTTAAVDSWQPGDIVCWDLNGSGLTHIGILSDIRGRRGLPLVIHNIGPTASHQDCLDNWKIIGHYRYPK